MNASITASLKNGVKIREDWETIKDDVMLSIVRAKFFQNKVYLQQLLSTKGARLCEHTKKDRYWGDGGDGSGQNRLGHILMAVRDEAERTSSL